MTSVDKAPKNKATVISSGTYDLNDFVINGSYLFTTGATLTNAPHTNGYMIVISNNPTTTSGQNNNVKQFWLRMGTNGTNDMNTLVRSRNGGSWSSWAQYAMTSETALLAPLASPTFTGTPAAPTPTANDNSTKLATTAYVDAADALSVHLAGTETLTGFKTFSAGLSISSSYRMSSTNRTSSATLSSASSPIQYGDATSGAITLTLPASSSNANIFFYIQKIDGSVNNVTVARNGTDTIIGATSYTLAAQYKYVVLHTSGSGAWYVWANN